MSPASFQNALILTGPTASGKSAIALELAEKLKAEIVAVDSMTLYRGMDIGTAKPTAEERSRVPHHLLDVLDPWESASVAWWLERASAAVADIEARGKKALLVGGTPFYLKAILCGLFPSPPSDQELRRQLEGEAETLGPPALHVRLASVDPASALRLHPNDVRRVVRALEVWQLTGRPLSDWQQQSWWGEGETGPTFPTGACLAIDIPRDELNTRISRRVESMFAAGWIEEVRQLRNLERPPGREASQALGYGEIAAFLDGRQTLDETIAEVQLRTRQYAKRQLTWFRSLSGCEFCDAESIFTRWTERSEK